MINAALTTTEHHADHQTWARGVHGKSEQRHGSIPTARVGQGDTRPVVRVIPATRALASASGEPSARSLTRAGRMRRTPEQRPVSTSEGPRRMGRSHDRRRRARFVKPGQHVEVWGRSLVGPWLAGFRPFPRAPPASPPGAGPPTANSRPISYSRLFGAADHATSPGPTHEPSQG
jgi:hypothetical protein